MRKVTMIKHSCPYCETIRDVKEVKRNETIEIKGKKVSYEAVHYECTECHNLFDTKEQMGKNLLAAREAYDLQYNSITSDKIIKIREKYNASQKAFSLILAMGELTINSYEQNKSVPNSSNRLLLQLAENPLIFFEMYEKNKSKIGAIQREHIESSQMYKDCQRWGGLENLYQHLSSTEREVIENKTYIVGSSVVQIVSDMVKAEMSKTSFEIYADAHEVEEGTIPSSTDINREFSIGVA